MSYTPIGWQTGDTITAEKLNKMDNGWSAGMAQLFSETVTTVAGEFGNTAVFVYSELIDAPSITVTFDGTDYECERILSDGMCFYGGFSQGMPDFTDYPFLIVSDGFENTNTVATETTGTHTFALKCASVEVSSDFDAAVKTCVDVSAIPMLCVSGTTTYDEMFNASSAGRILYFKPYGKLDTETAFITSFTDESVFYSPEYSVIASFANGVFTVEANA